MDGRKQVRLITIHLNIRSRVRCIFFKKHKKRMVVAILTHRNALKRPQHVVDKDKNPASVGRKWWISYRSIQNPPLPTCRPFAAAYSVIIIIKNNAATIRKRIGTTTNTTVYKKQRELHRSHHAETFRGYQQHLMAHDRETQSSICMNMHVL